MRSAVIRRLTLGLSATLVAATLTAVASSSPAGAATITCSTSSSGKAASFYAGPSASYLYDKRFSTSASVPGLSSRTPQGLAVWSNWDGHGHTLLIVTAYRAGAHAWVYGINPATGGHTQTAEIAETHAGGAAVIGSWIYIQGGGNSIRRYRASDLRRAFQHSGSRLYVKSVATQSVVAASFLTSHNGILYTGRFNETGRDYMWAYVQTSTGALTPARGNSRYQVPMKTQGVVVTDTRFIFSTSYGRTKRSNLYVVKRGYSSLDGAKLKCFRAPSMSEGAAASGGRFYLVFESGSYLYRSTALNPIYRLHKASLSSLTGLV